MNRWLVCALLLGGVSCKDQGLKNPDEAAAPATPPPQAAAPGPHNGLPAGHPAITADAAPAGGGGSIEGRLELGPDAVKHVKAGDTVFVIARNGATNAMVAVTKLQAPEKFPLPFKLTSQNIMMAGGTLSGSIKLSARVDKDGDAITKKPGDVVGEVAQAVDVPAQNVVLTLNQVL